MWQCLNVASLPCPLALPAVQLSNVVLKWVQEGEFVAAATFQQLLLQTSTDDWREGRKVRFRLSAPTCRGPLWSNVQRWTFGYPG